MLRTILFLAFLLFQVQVFAQNPPFPIANIGGLNLNIATDTCFSGAPITSLSPGQKLVSSETLSSNCGIWQRVSIPSVSQHTDTSGYICGGLSALCDIVPEPASAYVEVINTDTSGLFVRPAPVAGHVTINGANAKIWDGQRFATTGNVQTVGGGTWREIYLTDNCSQLTGWVSSTFLMFYNGVGINENENALQFEVFPNPGTDNIQLTFHNPENKDYTVTLFNTKGKSVDKHYNTKQIDISKLSDGVYFIKLEQGTLSSSQKFVKLTD